MKRLSLILALGAALLAIAASRAESRSPYVGLYSDADRQCMEVYMPSGGGFWPFELWIWWLPGDDGLAATMHKLVFPSNVIRAGVTTNADCALVLGCECGISDPAYCCQRVSCAIDWVWSHRIQCFLLNSGPSYITIIPCPGQPLVAASCAPGYPVEEVIVIDQLALNQECGCPVEPGSWGAVKSLYR